MVREPNATRQPTPQDNQLMSKHRVLSLKPQLRLEWRGQDGQNETEQPDHSASLGDSITASTRIRFSVHTRPYSINPSARARRAAGLRDQLPWKPCPRWSIGCTDTTSVAGAILINAPTLGQWYLLQGPAVTISRT